MLSNRARRGRNTITRILGRNPVLSAIIALAVLWFVYRAFVWTPSSGNWARPSPSPSPKQTVMTSGDVDLLQMGSTPSPPTTISPFEAALLSRKQRHATKPPQDTFDATIVIPCRAGDDPTTLIEAVASDTKLRVEFVVSHDPTFTDDMKKRCQMAATSRPISFVLIVPKRNTFPRLYDLANRGAFSSDPDTKHLVFLSPHLSLTSPLLVDSLISELTTLPRAGAVGCATLMQQPSGGLTIAQHGYDVREGPEREPSFAKRQAGFSGLDPRVNSCDDVSALPMSCFAIPRDLWFKSRGFGAFQSGADLAVDGMLEDDAKASLERRLGALVGAIESELSRVDITDRRLNTASFKNVIRRAYDRVITATQRAEQLHITLVRRPLDPTSQAEIDVVGQDVSIRLPTIVKCVDDTLSQLNDVLAHHDVSPDEAAWDLSMKVLDRNLQIYSCGKVTALEDMSKLPPAVQRGANRILAPTSFQPSTAFTGAWRSKLRALLPLHQRFTSNPLRVVWDAFCCGCCGFSNEIIHFITPLEKLLKVSLIPEPSCFCSGFPGAVSDALSRMHISYEQYVVERSSDDEIVVWVSHTDPMSFRNNVFSKRRPDYIVGRSMYEFTRIDENWVDAAMTDCDEIWVPAEWVKRMFVASGIEASKLTVIPEAVDVHFFNPAAQRKVTLPLEKSLGPERSWRHWCNKPSQTSAFKFYTNFKWEDRKGWDTLFAAYYKSFKGETNVVLWVHTHIWFSGGPETYGDKHNTTFLKLEVQRWAQATLGIDVDDLPPFCFLTEDLSEVAVAEVYNSVNAFVLPTRGEGWGLPTIQAMSMGLPTISTDWGGQQEFLDPDVSFPIPLDAVEELPADSVYRWRQGKKWGTPSLNATATFMRLVFDHPAKAAAVGARAREFVVKKFSEEAVTKLVDDRLMAIREAVLKQRVNTGLLR